MNYYILKPDYFDKFKCIGNECDDHCCKNWSITIDKNSYNKYKEVEKIDFRDKLLNNIIVEKDEKDDIKSIRFKLINNNCAFLNDNNLCDIYINLGEQSMCNTCKIYPRIFNSVNGYIEKSLMTSCPEVARLVLKNKKPMKFICTEEDIDRIFNISKFIDSYKSENIIEKYFQELNLFSVKLMQNRSFTIEDRLVILGLFCNSLEKDSSNIINTINYFEKNIENNSYKNISEILSTSYDSQIQLSLTYSLICVIFNKEYSNKTFSDFINICKKYLNISENSIESVIEKFEKGIKYYNSFFDKHSYILENYLVNMIFSKVFPCNAKTVFESYTNLTTNFIYLKFVIICLCGYYKENFSEDIIIKIIQSYSVCINHNSSINNYIVDLLKQNNRYTLANIVLMIGK